MSDTFAPPAQPTHLEAEAAALGAAMHAVAYARGLVETLDPGDYDRHAHALTHEAIAALIDAGQHPDLVTVTDQLATSDQLDEVGGPVALYDLLAGVPTPAAWPTYAAIVKREADRRRRIRQLIAELRTLRVDVEERTP